MGRKNQASPCLQPPFSWGKDSIVSAATDKNNKQIMHIMPNMLPSNLFAAVLQRVLRLTVKTIRWTSHGHQTRRRLAFDKFALIGFGFGAMLHISLATYLGPEATFKTDKRFGEICRAPSSHPQSSSHFHDFWVFFCPENEACCERPRAYVTLPAPTEGINLPIPARKVKKATTNTANWPRSAPEIHTRICP